MRNVFIIYRKQRFCHYRKENIYHLSLNNHLLHFKKRTFSWENNQMEIRFIQLNFVFFPDSTSPGVMDDWTFGESASSAPLSLESVESRIDSVALIWIEGVIERQESEQVGCQYWENYSFSHSTKGSTDVISWKIKTTMRSIKEGS